jgi:hypothetical protein
MSMMPTSGGPNPFTIASNFIGRQYAKGARQQRDEQHFNSVHQAMMLHGAQMEATMKHTSQQARLTERSLKAQDQRANAWAGSIHSMAEPGTQVSFKHGSTSANYTAKKATAPVTPKAGRVPVKKVRGGKKTP